MAADVISALNLAIPALFAVQIRVPRRALPADLPDDEVLVRRAQGGDSWAEEALYRRHVNAVAGTVIRLMGRVADAEDIVQDAFTLAFEKLATLRDGAALRAWLVRIAVHLVRRRYRRLRITRALGLDRGTDDATLAALAAPAAADAGDQLVAIDRVLQRVGTNERIAWMLRRVEGFELEDVARACGCSLATVKRRVAAVDEVVRRADVGGAG